MTNHVVWAEKYRPKTIDDCVLPARIQDTLKSYIDGGEITTHLLFHGSTGIGKTTSALAMIKEIGAEYILVNASLYGNIDNLRNNAQSFASTVSMDFKRKYIIWDEAERITPQAQDAIRGFIETYSDNCGHIFTCNRPNMVNDAIRSRCSTISFLLTEEEKDELMPRFFKAVVAILKAEGVEYDKAALGKYILKRKNKLDFRNILMELQRLSTEGLTGKTLSRDITQEFDELITFLSNKDFHNMRKWVSDNSSILDSEIFEKFYHDAKKLVKEKSLAYLVILLSKYQVQSAQVVNKEINMAAFLTEVMIDVEFE
jgi:DNA polymerase III delta prime subunit